MLLYQLLVLAVLLVLLGFVVVNLAVLPRLVDYSLPERYACPKVAILVPVRNEEVNIEACVYSLLAQDYSEFEVWLYDDCSTDSTPEIARHLAAVDPRLHVIEGREEPPESWVGKAH